MVTIHKSNKTKREKNPCIPLINISQVLAGKLHLTSAAGSVNDPLVASVGQATRILSIPASTKNKASVKQPALSVILPALNVGGAGAEIDVVPVVAVLAKVGVRTREGGAVAGQSGFMPYTGLGGVD